MPKQPFTVDFVVGFIYAKVADVRKIVFRMENRLNFSMNELTNIQLELEEIDAEVQLQAKMITDERVRPKMMEFDQLMKRAIEQRERREQRARAIEAGNEQQEHALRDVEPDKMAQERQPTREDLDPYASDNEEPLAPELMSIVRPAKKFQPIEFRPNEPGPSRQGDLRDQLENQRTAQHAAGSYGVHRESREQGRRGGHKRGGGAYREFVPSRNSERSRSDVHSQAGTVSSVSSFGSYVSQQQERFSAPVSGRAYPPVQYEPDPPLVRNDPNLIGSSEVFIHPPRRANICPHCSNGAQHKLYRCTTFLRMGLQQKWYTALNLGVCLNCLIRGHSHFACKTPGACIRCGKRHNSKLCPEGPINKPH